MNETDAVSAKDENPIYEILDLWDDLDGAIDRVITALPGQMTDASTRLEAERLRFRERLQKYAFNASSATKAAS